MTMTHIFSFASAIDVQNAAATYQAASYKTVQIGPVSVLHTVINGTPNYWTVDDGKKGYLLIATMDPITDPA